MTAALSADSQACASTARAPRSLSSGELLALLAVAATLPLIEAPKNIAWLAFVVLWLFNSVRQQNFGRLCPWGSVALVAVLASTVLSIATSASPQWGELGNMVVYLTLGALLCRTQCSARQLGWLCAVLIAATLVGAAWGVWLQASGKREFIELHSVGHVNHSALYGAGVALLACAALLAYWTKLDRTRRAGLVLVNLAFFFLMFAWGSRGALIAYLLGALVLGAWYGRAHGRRLVQALGVVLLLALVTLWLSPAIIDKTRGNLEGTIKTARIAAMRSAVEVWRQYPLTGIGAANFKAASPERMRTWLSARNEQFDADDYLFSNHAHSLYFNTLAERGLIGLLAVLLLGAWWARELLRRRPLPGATRLHWLTWGAGWSGFVVVYIGGVFNTSLHHEHGMLAMMGLGLLIGSTPRATAMNAPGDVALSTSIQTTTTTTAPTTTHAITPPASPP